MNAEQRAAALSPVATRYARIAGNPRTALTYCQVETSTPGAQEALFPHRRALQTIDGGS